MKTKLFIVFLSLVVIATMMPLSVFADTTTPSGVESSTSYQNEKETPMNLTAVGGDVTVGMVESFSMGKVPEFSLCYSFDPDAKAEEWKDFDKEKGEVIPAGKTIYFRNAIDDGEGHYPGWARPTAGWLFTMNSAAQNATVEANGNIMSLAYATDFANENEVEEAAGFYNLFYNCTLLTKAPLLPATKLADKSYTYMFHSCRSLVEPPELPADVLSQACYEFMFRFCDSLKYTPKLNATTLAPACYSHMFDSCPSLATASELPATEMKEGCYRGMFYGCPLINSLEVGFDYQEGFDYESALNTWLPNTEGTIYCLRSWEGHESQLQLPEGWKVSFRDEVVTPLGDTGLSLVGKHYAEKDKDYKLYIGKDKYSIDINTSGWEIIGNGPKTSVYFIAEEDDAILKMGDLNIAFFELWTNTPSTVQVNGTVTIGDGNAQGDFALLNDVTLTGEGFLNIPNGDIAPYTSLFTPNVTLDIAKLHICEKEDSEWGYCIWADNLDILRGQVVLESKSHAKSGYNHGAIATADSFNISDNAEVFLTGNDAAIVAPKSTLDPTQFLGHVDNLSFNQKRQVVSPVQLENIDIQSFDYDTLAVVGANSPAKTVYHPGTNPEPEIFNVTFKYQDGTTPDVVKKVTEGDVVAQPENPAREGYTFEGWFCNAEGEGTTYDFARPVTDDLTLYAKWTKNDNPKPVPPINPSDNNDAQGGTQTGDTAMPIIFIALGFVAGIIIFEATRRLRSK